MREISTAMLVGNLVHCFPMVVLVSRHFRLKVATYSGRVRKSTGNSAEEVPNTKRDSWDKAEHYSRVSTRELRDEAEMRRGEAPERRSSLENV
jgi:hypothetical protein